MGAYRLGTTQLRQQCPDRTARQTFDALCHVIAVETRKMGKDRLTLNTWDTLAIWLHIFFRVVVRNFI
jgi:hypothetical protein